MTEIQKTMQQALEALELTENEWVYGLYRDEKRMIGDAIYALRSALAQPEPLPPPPECQTEAEKTAYAFGWWRALEVNRAAPAAPSKTLDWSKWHRDLKPVQPVQVEQQPCRTLCELCIKRGYDFCANAAKTTPIVVDAPAAQPETVPLAEYKKLQALVTSQGIRLMEYESAPAAQPDARKVIEQLVEALENHSGNYKLTEQECAVHDAAIQAGQQWLAAAPAAQPDHIVGVNKMVPLTCDTCKHSTAGKDSPAIRIYEETCFECSQYYADRYESHGIGADK